MLINLHEMVLLFGVKLTFWLNTKSVRGCGFQLKVKTLKVRIQGAFYIVNNATELKRCSVSYYR